MLRTTLSAAPRCGYETPTFRDSPQMWFALQFGTLQECVLTCTCVVFLVFVIKRIVPNGKNIKNLKISKLEFCWFLYQVSFILEDQFYSFIEKYFRFFYTKPEPHLGLLQFLGWSSCFVTIFNGSGSRWLVSQGVLSQMLR